MAIRRIYYLLFWLGCLIFFWAYRQWITWFVLVIVTLLPLFSLLISLPTIFTAKLHFSIPETLTIGTPCTLQVNCSSPFPVPLWECTAEVKHTWTGHRQEISNGSLLPTDHCGMLTIGITKARIYDYSGLFRFPVRFFQNHRLILRPNALSSGQYAALEARYHEIAQFHSIGDSYEPSPFRPGDVPRRIHWKLTRKTGQLFLNKPIDETQHLLLRLHLHGTEVELDQKMGTLLWLGNLLTARGVPFEIACFSACEYEQWLIEDNEGLMHTMDTILSRECSEIPAVWQPTTPNFLQYDIGAD